MGRTVELKWQCEMCFQVTQIMRHGEAIFCSMFGVSHPSVACMIFSWCFVFPLYFSFILIF